MPVSAIFMTKTVDLRPQGDPLSHLLRRLEFSAEVFFRSDYCGHWAVDTSGSAHVPFHLVCEGEGWLHSGKQPPERMLPGELALFPRDTQHVLTGTKDKPAAALINRGPSAEARGPSTRLVCGFFRFNRDAARPLLDTLPENLVINLSDSPSASVRSLVQLWIAEAASDRLGTDLAVDLLAELVFIEMLRAEASAGRLTGLIPALADSRLGAVLAGIHADPGAAHGLAELTARANLSESALTQRFKTATGMSPAHYVRHWRMQAAAQLLRGNRQSVADIAAAVGYLSEVAFRKAFRSYMGATPGRYRREHNEKLGQ